MDKNLIDDIETLIFQGKVQSEILTILRISRYMFEKSIASLNNPESTNYDKERFEKLKVKQLENTNFRKAEAGRNNSKGKESIRNFLAKEVIPNRFVLLLAYGEMTFIEAARRSGMSYIAFLNYISKIKNEELSSRLKPILKEYGFELDENNKNKKSLLKYPLEVQKEIALMALTYRVSVKNIAKMFNTTIEDVIETFLSFDNLETSLGYLFLETIKEDEINEKKSIVMAKSYWYRRNNLVKQYNETKKTLAFLKSNNASDDQIEEYSQILQDIRSLIKTLYAEIDDTKVYGTIGKDGNTLTLEEKDIIANYTLKYYFSLKESEDRLKRKGAFIWNYMEDLAERNAIFAEKLDFYYLEKQIKNEMYIDKIFIPFANRNKPIDDNDFKL